MLKNCGFLCLLTLVLRWWYTRLCFPTTRLVQFAIHFHDRHAMRLGTRLTIGRAAQIGAYSIESSRTLHFICKDAHLSESVHISAKELMEMGGHN